MVKKKKKKSRSSSLRRNEVSEKEQPKPSRSDTSKYLLTARPRAQDYEFAKKAAQIPVGTDEWRRKEAERTQARLAAYKGMSARPYSRPRSVSRARPSASRTVSYSASASPPAAASREARAVLGVRV